jgi:hypothetical protein
MILRKRMFQQGSYDQSYQMLIRIVKYPLHITIRILFITFSSFILLKSRLQGVEKRAIRDDVEKCRLLFPEV